jgi:CheY-like chemotaxis protein
MSRALIVDDSADSRLVLATVLQANGFEVREAATGLDALASLGRSPRPDVVVLDVQMPKLDGWAALHAIRGEPATATLPVVLCTVRSSAADQARAWAAGCDGYLVKPFPVEELAPALQAVIDRPSADRARLRGEKLRELEAELAGEWAFR